MKSFSAIILFVFAACTNSGDAIDNRKDSLDSVAHAQKQVIDSAADRARKKVDSIEKQGKKIVDSTTAIKKRTVAKRRSF